MEVPARCGSAAESLCQFPGAKDPRAGSIGLLLGTRQQNGHLMETEDAVAITNIPSQTGGF